MARAREASATSCFPLATSCFLLDAPETPRTSLPLSFTLPRPHPLPWTSLSLARTEPPPPTSSLAATATPSLADALKGSASTPSFSPPSHKVPDTLQHRHHRRFHRRPPRIFTVDSPPSPLPRARHLPHPNHRELLHVLPLTPWLAARRSRHFIAGRSTPPPELVAVVAPVTIWSPWHA